MTNTLEERFSLKTLLFMVSTLNPLLKTWQKNTFQGRDSQIYLGFMYSDKIHILIVISARASVGEAERIFLVHCQYETNLKLVVPNVADYETVHLQIATVLEQSSKGNTC